MTPNWDNVELAEHMFRVLMLVLTLLVNGTLIVLILRHRWVGRVLERAQILLIFVMDFMYGVAYLIRYFRVFREHPEALRIHGVSRLMTENESICKLSGPFVSLAMNLNITWIALLSYARYRRIVRRKMFPQWLWVLIEVVISLPIVVFCLLGGFFRLYVIIPGSFLCQIWSPTRDDPIRTPIQLYFSLNLVVSLATTVVCYTCVSLHQHRALENLLESEGSANNEGSYLQRPEAVYSQCDLDVDEPGISFLETHLGDSIKENLDVYYQQKMISISYRIFFACVLILSSSRGTYWIG
ncbi:hypothetical protein DSO57_1009250 [Entomophthora muscae]|uniref:Uncharacterized protein n=1 Tax=Entomophthora muscae TaxID=34485 RepID=A0ACC2UGZ2_9FUNG|nr:hypothetical protein DSO57_1009250 [Entomophthora muscae]